MSDAWWTLYLENGCEKDGCFHVSRAPLAQRETLEELLEIIDLLDEAEETSNIFCFVQGDPDEPRCELRYDTVMELLKDE